MDAHSKFIVAIACIAATVASPASTGAIPSADWAGTWQLDLKQSRFSSPAPNWERRTIGISHNRMSVRSQGETASAKSIRFNYSVAMDGRFYPLVGNPDGDSISMRLASPTRVNIEVRRHGKTAATAITEVSGATLTMRRHRLALSGNASDDLLVYERAR
jgi:hypothetical protein